MSDKPDIDIPAVIAAAVASAGPMKGSTTKWKAAVNNAIPDIVAMMGEGSHQTRIATEVADAVVFTAVYRGYKLEETSKRCLVTIETQESKRYPDGLEPIRTHRTDNGQGREMRRRLDELDIGDAIRVWKSMESIDDETKVRVLVHFEKTWKKGDDSPQEQAPSKPPAEQRVPSQPLTDQIDTERLHDWRKRTHQAIGEQGYQMLMDRLEEQGYDIMGVSEVEWASVVKPIIQQIRKDQQ